MARPKLQKPEKRDIRKQVRFNLSEWRALHAKATRLGLDYADVIRMDSCGVEPKRRKAPPFRAHLIRIQAAIGKIRSNVRQMAHVCGDRFGMRTQFFDPIDSRLEKASIRLLDYLAQGGVPSPAARDAILSALSDFHVHGLRINDIAKALNRTTAKGKPVPIAKDYIEREITALAQVSDNLSKALGHDRSG